MYERIEGKNITLRRAKMSDYLSMLNNVWSDEEVYKWMLYKPTLTIEEAKERCERSIKFQEDHYAWFIAENSTDEAIGLCAIEEAEPHIFEECGICIGRKYQGKGYGKEVVSLLLELVFEKLNGEYFRYGYFVDNTKSKKLANHFGFVYEKTEEIIRPWDSFKKNIEYCVLSKDNWHKNK